MRPRIEPPIESALIPAILQWARMPVVAAMPYSAIVELTERLAYGDPHIGLRWPRELTFASYAYGELAARASKTVSDALERAARYLPVPGHTATIERDHELRMRIVPPPRKKAAPVLAEYALAWSLMQSDAHPVRVWFSHARPRDLGPVHLALGTREATFGAEDDGFAITLDEAARTRPTADERLAATMDDLAARALTPMRSYAELVAAKIDALLPNTDIESVADALHASARTVQRRLEDEGTRYSEVLDDVRARRARECLRTDAPLAEIAARIGFSDLAPFTRAFKRWTGTTPGAFRRR